jgi:hypothetical protein
MHFCVDAYGMVQGECGDAMSSNFSELSKNVLYQQPAVEELAQRQIDKVFGREKSK